MKNLGLPISVEDLLSGKFVEWERLEFKEGWNPEAVLHSVCAFANDFHNLGGGYIIVGVKEKDGRALLPPVGLELASIDRIQKELLRICSNKLQPHYSPITVPVEVAGRLVLVIWVPGGQVRPYKARVNLAKDTNEWTYFIRKQASTVRAKEHDEQELLGLAGSIPFDDRINQSASVENLSLPLIQSFLKEVKSDLLVDSSRIPLETLGRQMNIVGGSREAAFPKNVGLLFFTDEPFRFFPYTQIDIAWFPEGRGGNHIGEKVFKGPLALITREALSYIKRNFLHEIVIKKPDKAEAQRAWNYAYPALEEAIVNAVYHRSYEIYEPVEVQILHDEITVLSHPGPDTSINMEDLRNGRAVSRRYRNRRIGEFLKELELTEGRSTGIPKMLKAVAENGSPPPQFETDPERRTFLIRFPVHPDAKFAVPEQVQRKVLETSTRHQVGTKSAPSRHQVGTKSAPSRHQASSSPSLNAEQIKILTYFTVQRTLKELMDLMGRTDRTKIRNQVLRPFLDGGFLEMIYPDKPTSSKQQYRLTEKGMALVERHS